MTNFVSLSNKCDGYQPDSVTPYMHIMVFHMPEDNKETQKFIYTDLVVKI